MWRFAAAPVLVLATLVQNSLEIDGGWWLYGIPLVAALFLQYRWPLTTLSMATVGAFAHLAVLGAPVRALDFVVPITVYTFAVQTRTRWLRFAGLGFVLAATFAWSFIAPGLPPYPEPDGGFITAQTVTTEADGGLFAALATMLPAMAILVAAFALGDATRTRRAHLLTLEQRAEDMRRERHQREALATATERGRLSREIHDVVAHGLSVIVMQAQGGAAMLRQSPDRAGEALEHIIVTGRAAIADMRSLLGLARSGPQLAPQPGLADLPALVDRLRDTGTPVALHIDGPPAPLPTAVDLSVYRIAQEALTNVIKHAGAGARAKVRLAFEPGHVEVEITDNGAGSRPDFEAGHGLRGIAERVAALGGQTSSGPMDSGGFRVWAQLPVDAGLQETAEPS